MDSTTSTLSSEPLKSELELPTKMVYMHFHSKSYAQKLTTRLFETATCVLHTWLRPKAALNWSAKWLVWLTKNNSAKTSLLAKGYVISIKVFITYSGTFHSHGAVILCSQLISRGTNFPFFASWNRFAKIFSCENFVSVASNTWKKPSVILDVRHCKTRL